MRSGSSPISSGTQMMTTGHTGPCAPVSYPRKAREVGPEASGPRAMKREPFTGGEILAGSRAPREFGAGGAAAPCGAARNVVESLGYERLPRGLGSHQIG